MSEKIDIVRRLRLEVNAIGEFSTYASREYRRLLLDSVAEIEQLRKERDAAQTEVSTLERNAEITYENHKRIVAELTAERDEAMRLAMSVLEDDFIDEAGNIIIGQPRKEDCK